MIRIAIRILLTALGLTYIFPMIAGVHFAGSFWPHAVIMGFLMAVVAYCFSFVLAAFTVLTFGIGCIVIVLGFWLIPAIELQILAHFFPQYLAFDSWGSSIQAGLVLLFINVITKHETD